MRGAWVLAAALLQVAGPRPEPKDFRYVREVQMAREGDHDKSVARVCAVVPGEVYARSATLGDVRVYANGTEVPYALTSSGTVSPGNEGAAVLNAGTRAGHVVFDLQMPARTYSTVVLDLAGQDFVATARVTGLRDANDKAPTELGTFTLFDMTGQRLGRSTSLPLAETSFPFLHVDLQVAGVAGKGAPEVSVSGASVPASREAQTLYTTVAETTAVVERGRESVATFTLPAHVPVERVSFAMAAGDRTNFSRPVAIRARVEGDPQAQAEELDGEISRVRVMEGGKEIRAESLGVAATLGANGQAAAKVEVAVENGDDRPLRIAAVRLEMRERELCFDGPGPDAPVKLFYGNEKVEAPVYDYARLFTPGQPARVGVLGPEAVNPEYVARVEVKSFSEAHPGLLWVALLAMVGVLGAVAFRSAKRV